jgi:hypothetical protein
MVRKEALQAVGGFPVGIQHGEDLDTWLRLALRYPIAWTKQPVAVHRQDAEGRVCLETRVGDCPCADRLEEYARQAKDPETTRLIGDFLARQRLEMVGRNWRAGEMDWVRRLLQAPTGGPIFRLWRMAWKMRVALAPGKGRAPHA